VHLFTGSYPNPVIIANLYLMGLGLGLVVARVGRLGPFEGLLGSPWFEAGIQELLTREAARALRYERDLTVVALRSTSGRKIDFQRNVRATDQVVSCRDGWHLLVLPETDRVSALLLLRQICAETVIQAALVAPDAERPRHRIETELLALMRTANQPGSISVRGIDIPELLPLLPLAS
jgi:hypothetical protein